MSLKNWIAVLGRKVEWSREEHDFEFFDGSLSGSPWSQVVGGWLAPAVIGGYGVADIVRRHAALWWRGNGLELFGTNAVLLGSALIGAALFLHGRYCWRATRKLAVAAPWLEGVSLLGGIIAFMTLIWRVIWR
ncbi:MAG: hypothetical protein PHQ27_09610 [Victivallales bacterium]|nr:hypothetical protein [Victivallales bacterium]